MENNQMPKNYADLNYFELSSCDYNNIQYRYVFLNDGHVTEYPWPLLDGQKVFLFDKHARFFNMYARV